MKNISEDEFIKLFNLPDDHCNSCHKDANDGYYDSVMIEKEVPESGIWADICCVVCNNYDAKYKK